MEIRNAQHNRLGTIDCEIEHPDLGWIPFTASPDDEDKKGRGIYDEIIASGAEIAPYSEPLADVAVRKRTNLENGRKAAESAGITLNSLRYAGDPSNRQALMEALDLADSTGQTTFATWKDSDDKFHSDHPVADVRQALHDIAARRGELIAREGELNAQIDAALEAEDRDALEAVEWSEG